MMKKTRYIVGIDEAGRGPLAGPVSVGVFAVPVDFDMSLIAKVKDSKQLTELKREFWYGVSRRAKRAGLVRHSVAMSSARMIDERGIVFAITHAMSRALNSLEIDPELTSVLLDGGLRAPSVYKDQKTIIKGDEKEPVIALASIMAKVHRDRFMHRMALRYPAYGFEIHKGYGTKFHGEMLKKYGLSDIHRRSFCRSYLK